MNFYVSKQDYGLVRFRSVVSGPQITSTWVGLLFCLLFFTEPIATPGVPTTVEPSIPGRPTTAEPTTPGPTTPEATTEEPTSEGVLKIYV